MKFLPIVSGGLACLITLILACSIGDFGTELPAQVDFNLHIKPLLSDRCFACHGPDEKAREAKLSLHRTEGLFAALEGDSSRFIIAPGKLESSEVYARIHSDDPEYMMPPPASNLTFSDHDKALITKWIKQGASWKKHWAFIPPELPEIPRVKIKEWQKEPIDAFVYEKEIVYEVGFRDTAYFSRCFSSEFGVSPKDLRRKPDAHWSYH
jgi:AraC-like DNA-binding protein